MNNCGVGKQKQGPRLDSDSTKFISSLLHVSFTFDDSFSKIIALEIAVVNCFLSVFLFLKSRITSEVCKQKQNFCLDSDSIAEMDLSSIFA